jgi:hypothetical protein
MQASTIAVSKLSENGTPELTIPATRSYDLQRATATNSVYGDGSFEPSEPKTLRVAHEVVKGTIVNSVIILDDGYEDDEGNAQNMRVQLKLTYDNASAVKQDLEDHLKRICAMVLFGTWPGGNLDITASSGNVIGSSTFSVAKFLNLEH